jgi:hypothetical protein
MNNETSLEQCKRLIETTLSWGEPASWSNEDFEDLSERIFQKTAVRLSVSTLKRIWGKVKYDHTPTTATLNALAGFAGFTGWRDFQRQHPGPASPEILSAAPVARTTASPDTSSSGPFAPPVGPERRTRGFLAPLIIGTIAFAAILSLLSARFIHSAGPTPALRFDSHSTSDDLPNSVVFDYDATPLHP